MLINVLHSSCFSENGLNYIFGALLSTVVVFLRPPFLKLVIDPRRAPLAADAGGGEGAGAPEGGAGGGGAEAGGGGGGGEGPFDGGGGGGGAAGEGGGGGGAGDV